LKLSVVILNYNVRYFLELCLKSVTEATKNINAEIIVVDNHSADDSCRMVKTLFPQVILIENKENQGFSKGNNTGVAQAKGEYICILNPDTVVAEDTFTQTLAFAEKQTNLGIIGCRLIDGKGIFLPESKRNIPTPWVSVKKIFGNPIPYYATQINQRETGEVPVLVGAFMLLKKNTFNVLNGFDEDFFMYGEDVDISYRALQAGLKNFYFPQTTIIHYKGESTLKDFTYAKRFYKAMKLFYKKHFRNYGFFDVVVWLGALVMPLVTRNKPEKFTKPEKYVLVTYNKQVPALGNFKNKIETINSITSYTKHTEYIFDNSSLTFKSIIRQMDAFPENKDTTFKILPKESSFLIGSNSSRSRGEIHMLS